MLGHQTLFLCGVWWLYLPLLAQAFGTILAITAFFHNGGRFYVDHFWKAYERNTSQYVDAAFTVLTSSDGQGGSENIISPVASNGTNSVLVDSDVKINGNSKEHE